MFRQWLWWRCWLNRPTDASRTERCKPNAPVLAPPRSYTWLITALLSQHPELAMLVELGWKLGYS